MVEAIEMDPQQVTAALKGLIKFKALLVEYRYRLVREGAGNAGVEIAECDSLLTVLDRFGTVLGSVDTLEVARLAQILGVKAGEVLKVLMEHGRQATLLERIGMEEAQRVADALRMLPRTGLTARNAARQACAMDEPSVLDERQARLLQEQLQFWGTGLSLSTCLEILSKLEAPSCSEAMDSRVEALAG